MMGFNEGIPVAALITAGVQTAFVLLWVGRAGARLDMMQTRMDRHDGVNERLARLEEQGVATKAALERIEDRLKGGRDG